MQRIRVLVVAGSATARRTTVDTLQVDAALDVVGSAATAAMGFAKAAALHPDVVLLDADLGDCEVTRAVTAMHTAHPEVVVLLVARPTEDGARVVLESGADDYVTKPADPDSVVAVQRMVMVHVVPRIKALAGRRLPPGQRARRTPGSAPPARPRAERPRAVSPELATLLAASGVEVGPRPPPDRARKRPRTRPYSVLLLAASTGGPDALASVITGLAPDLRIPVLVVQHMPQGFTRLLAERLARVTAMRVAEAQDGEPARVGQILVAPGGAHLELHREGPSLVARLSAAPPENFVRPAADVLFRTAVEACGDGVLAAVLTGMGRDGEAGARLIQTAGGTVIAQDEATSVVWGMPGAVVGADLADDVLPLPRIGAELSARVLRRF